MATSHMSESSGFVAFVEYRQPSCSELEQMFGWVWDTRFGDGKFVPIDACKDVPHVNREIAFELVHLDEYMASSEAAVAALGVRAFRPALYEEQLAFAAKYPDEQKKYPIVALGSSYRVEDPDSPAFGRDVFAFVGYGDGGLADGELERYLAYDWTVDEDEDEDEDADGMSADFRYLVVRV